MVAALMFCVTPFTEAGSRSRLRGDQHPVAHTYAEGAIAKVRRKALYFVISGVTRASSSCNSQSFGAFSGYTRAIEATSISAGFPTGTDNCDTVQRLRYRR